MRAVLRYRRIPFEFVLQFSREAKELPAARVPLLPTFYLPDEHGKIVPTTGSTPHQRKCLRWLRESYARLEPDARRTVDMRLDGSGCEALSDERG